jgi:hypothetical protein
MAVHWYQPWNLKLGVHLAFLSTRVGVPIVKQKDKGPKDIWLPNRCGLPSARQISYCSSRNQDSRKGMEKSVSSWCFIICSEICGITLIIGLSSVGSHNSAISRLWAQITCTADLLFSDYRYHILICNGMAKPNTLWDVSSAGTPH